MLNPFKKYYCIKQHDETDCGPACLATVSKQYDLKIPISKIRQIAGTDTEGTNALGLIQAAEKLGFTAKGVKAKPEHLQDELPLPAIAHIIKDGLPHYIVIQEIKKNKIIVADPASGIVKYNFKDFIDLWSGVLIIMVPADKFKAGDETTGLFDRFFGLILPHKKLLMEIFLASILYTGLGMIGAFYFKYLIDTVLSDGLLKTLHIISIGVVILTIFKTGMDAFRKHLLLHLSQKIDISLILNYYQHVLDLPLSFFDSRKVGEILSRLNDASKIRRAISGATISVMIDTLLVIAGGIVLYFQSAVLFKVTVLIIPLYVLIVWGFNKSFRQIHRQEMEQAAEMRAYLVESISGVATIKAFNGEREAGLKTESKFIKFIKSIFKATWLRNFQSSLQSLLTSLAEVVILWVGGLQVIEGNISIGQLITFNALLAYFYDPLQNLIKLQPQLQEAFIASDRLGEIMDLDKEKRGRKKIKEIERLKGKIEIKGVDFRYGNRKKVLKNINLEISPGEKVALVGESGSGKTTLVKLILKYYLPEEGEIFLDGYNVKDLNLNFLRSRIGYVPQDVFLFSGSVRENIAFGSDGVTLAEIIDAAQKAKAHSFINQLPLRYDTRIGERGASLSGGQKQRLAIARAVLKKPDILLLDEATSNLDTVTETAIHDVIEEISHDITTIIIAHRLSTVQNSDKIIVLDKGEIIEKGSHKELITEKGFYYNLWQGNGLKD